MDCEYWYSEYTVEQKRDNLLATGFFDTDAIHTAQPEDIEAIHISYFENLNHESLKFTGKIIYE